MKLFAGIAMLLVLSTAGYAADVDGTWNGSIQGPAGDINLIFKFKADGATLTGTTLGFDGAEVAIKDGKIDGNNISWNVTFDFGGMAFTIAYKGVVSPDQIKVSGDAMGMPFDLLLKKSK